MQSILQVTIPFFALVWLGLMAARAGALPLDAVPGLNSFVLFFALPCMLFRFGYTLPLSELLDPVVLTVWLLCALTLVTFTVAVTLSPRVPMKDAAFGALVGAFPNSGFMGVPLLAAIAGPGAAGPVLSGLLCDIFITSSLCIALARSHEERNTLPAHGPGHGMSIDSHMPGDAEPDDELPAHPSLGARLALAARLMRATLSNPLPWAIALGAGAAALGISLPQPIDRIVSMLADAATPVALFTIGAVLWRAKVHAIELQSTKKSSGRCWVCQWRFHAQCVFGASTRATTNNRSDNRLRYCGTSGATCSTAERGTPVQDVVVRGDNSLLEYA